MLTHFLIEPFMKHEQKDELYICIQSHRYFDEIYFYHEGGVDVSAFPISSSRTCRIIACASCPTCSASVVP